MAAGQRLARRDPQLPVHQVETGDHLGNRMFDLKSRVHLHEIEQLVFDQEFHGAGPHIADRPGRGDGRPAHGSAQLGAQARRRRLFDHLLMAPLDRAVALEEVNRVALLVGENLDLDVTRLSEEFLQDHPRVAEGRGGFAAGAFQGRGEVRRPIDPAHPFAAAARRRLD